jgi:hypothetical protein
MAKAIAFVIVFGLLAGLVSILAAAIDWPHVTVPIATGALLLLGVLALASLKSGEGPAPLRHVERTKQRIDRMAPLTLAEYRNLIARLPAPSAEQQENFARFVAEAHRWHEYLPLRPPGARFHFFIDPVAGCDRAVSQGGIPRMMPRESSGAYPSSISTQQYRERFGYLAFSAAEGTTGVRVNAKGALVLGDDLAAVPDEQGQLRRLPPEVQRAGAVRLTAAVHPECADYSWRDQLAEQDRILNHERERQQRAMVEAMQRVCKLVYG